MFKTSPRDAVIYAAVALVLLTVSFCGAPLPACRAAGTGAAATLREE